MSRETQETGVEVLQEMEALGVGQEGPSLVPPLGTLLISSHPGGISLISLHGAKESLHFHHECRDLPISEDLLRHTNSPRLLTSLHHPLIILEDSHHASCRKNSLPDITMTDRLTPHTALTTLREEIILETCQGLHFTTTPVNDCLHQL